MNVKNLLIFGQQVLLSPEKFVQKDKIFFIAF